MPSAEFSSVPRALAHRLKRALLAATLGSSGVDDTAWRLRRDSLLDLLEPVRNSELTVSERRALIDLLSEAGPSTASRMSATQWRSEVDALVAELLAVHPG